MKIGFIGLGQMGGPMALNLARAGHTLTVHDLRSQATAPLKEAGAQAADSPLAATTASEVVCTSLPHPRASEAVYLGADGIIAGARPGTILIELSTVSTTLVKRLAAEAKKIGARFVDAGVSGGPAAARAGALTIMAGGAKEDVEKAMPVFEAIGQNIYHLGDVGAGMTVKLINNLLGHVNALVAYEGFALGVKAGVDPQVMLDVITRSSGDSIILRKKVATYVTTGEFGEGMSVDLFYKDQDLVCELGRELEVPMFVSNAALTVCDWARAAGLAEENWEKLITLWENLMNIKIGGKR